VSHKHGTHRRASARARPVGAEPLPGLLSRTWPGRWRSAWHGVLSRSRSTAQTAPVGVARQVDDPRLPYGTEVVVAIEVEGVCRTELGPALVAAVWWGPLHAVRVLVPEVLQPGGIGVARLLSVPLRSDIFDDQIEARRIVVHPLAGVPCHQSGDGQADQEQRRLVFDICQQPVQGGEGPRDRRSMARCSSSPARPSCAATFIRTE